MKKLFIEINKEEIEIEILPFTLRFFLNDCLVNTPFLEYIDNRVIVKESFFDKKLAVIDVCRYELIKQDSSFNLSSFNEKNSLFDKSKYNDHEIIFSNKTPSIFLILESPHIEEYDNILGEIKPIAPAQGATGININNVLVNLINHIDRNVYGLPNSKYLLNIINPIPYQTSLYYIHNHPLRYNSKNFGFVTLRNQVWKNLWLKNKSFESDLLNKIQIIQPDLILNCCTQELSDYIIKSIATTKVKVINCYHPYRWDNLHPNEIVKT